ncbi:MAG: HipA domain-containing protein [Propionibacteriaceae bacterium]|jgi:serine/threonine-protein kinase HipA|nr:HipA domain-containing protein [Propionibacteriaceae bacterium]
MQRLEVWLYGTLVGTLEGATWRDYDFRAADEGVARFGVLSTVLSEAIPLVVKARPASRAQVRRNFFDELLPEGITRVRLAQQASVEVFDTLGLLRRFGRDTAGALQIFDPTDPWEPPTPELRPLDAAAVRQLADSNASFPLGNDSVQGRISLAGVQPKLALVKRDGGWWQPLGGYPSTHIVKPAPERFPTMIFDEEYGCRIAHHLGLLDYEVTIVEFAGLPTLVAQRYDRSEVAWEITRLHQEDMNQALGASGDQKYQQYGGVTTGKRIATVVSRHGPEALQRWLRLLIFACAIGNLDLHGKNISLLRHPDGSASLAPAYDNVPLLHQPTNGELALAVDKVYRLADLRTTNLAAEALPWGVDNPIDIIDSTLDQISDFVAQANPLGGAHPQITTLITANITRLRRPPS